MYGKERSMEVKRPIVQGYDFQFFFIVLALEMHVILIHRFRRHVNRIDPFRKEKLGGG